MPTPEPITEGACTLGAVWGRGGHPSKVEALLAGREGVREGGDWELGRHPRAQCTGGLQTTRQGTLRHVVPSSGKVISVVQMRK